MTSLDIQKRQGNKTGLAFSYSDLSEVGISARATTRPPGEYAEESLAAEAGGQEMSGE